VKNERRFYYDNPPDILQIADHQFVEQRLIDLWRTNTRVAWVSFANCASIYLNTHQKTTANKIPESWKFKGKLDGKNVAHAFILSALLEDHQKRNTVLQVPHSGLQSERYKAAMRERNDRIRLYGQPELRHRCKKCVREYPAINGHCKY
jgi:KDZ transposase family protein